MSTTAVVPNPNTSAEMPLKSETLNYSILAEGEGEKASFSLTQSEKMLEKIANDQKKATEDGKTYDGPQVVTKVTVSKPIVGTMDGFNELFPNDKDKIAIINLGISKNFDRTVRKNLLETDDKNQLVYPFSDGVIDGTPFVQDVSVRTKMSDEEVAIKALNKIPGVNADVIANILAQIKAAQGQS